MGTRGPKPTVSFDDLYFYAQEFYQDFRHLREGAPRVSVDWKRYQEMKDEMEAAGLYFSDDELNAGYSDDTMEEESETRQFERIAIEESTRSWRTAGKPEVIDELLLAKTAERVREICKDAPDWPVRATTRLPHYLLLFADQFVDAKKTPRYPKSRSTNELKKLWFLCRALAGAVFGIETRTAINLVGSVRPEQSLKQSRDAKPLRKRKI